MMKMAYLKNTIKIILFECIIFFLIFKITYQGECECNICGNVPINNIVVMFLMRLCGYIVAFCASDPCQNGGTCREQQTAFCECTPGYYGDFCELGRFVFG